jgi:hypothetical protein
MTLAQFLAAHAAGEQASRPQAKHPSSLFSFAEPQSLTFWSAVDFAGEYQALMEKGVPIGIAVKPARGAFKGSATEPAVPGAKGRISEPAFQQLVRLVRATNRTNRVPIFVDSGAYSESATETFIEADWDVVLDRYEALAKAGGDRIFLVAPDAVGSFAGTEARLRKSAPRLRTLLDLGAHILLPLQHRKGSSLAQNAADLERAAGFGPADSAQVHPAIPWTNKVPVKPSMDALAAYLRERRPARIHFLGAGSANPNWERISRTVRSASPGTILQGDSNRFGAMRAKGRPLTRAGRLVDTGALELDPWSGTDADITDDEGESLGDETENLLDLFAWTTPAERRRIAEDAMLDDSDEGEALIDLFVKGPIEDFLEAREEAGGGDYLYEAVDAAWARRAARFASDRRRHLATRRVLSPPPSEQGLLRAVQRQAGLPLSDPRVGAWMAGVGVGIRRGVLDYPRGVSNPEGARRRLHDALQADEMTGELFRMNPANAARVQMLDAAKARTRTVPAPAASSLSAFLSTWKKR